MQVSKKYVILIHDAKILTQKLFLFEEKNNFVHIFFHDFGRFYYVLSYLLETSTAMAN